MIDQTRRKTLKTISLACAGLSLSTTARSAIRNLPGSLKFGVITDVHIGFIKDAPKRFAAFEEAMKQTKTDGVIQMGDFAYPNEGHQKYVDAFNALTKHPIHAIGNHELDHKLTRDDTKKSWGIPGYYYSTEVKGLKIIVLVGNDRGSPTYQTHGGYHSYIGKEQQEWLRKELTTANKPILIISHQPLAGRAAVDNAEEMQKILVSHRDKILLCLNGHSHIDQLLTIDGINYLHVNSASYYWLGGKIRTAFYRDPLFTIMTLDKKSGEISFTAADSVWSNGSPEEVGYFEKNKDLLPLKKHITPKISPYRIRPNQAK
ncbi:MAG: metallophosphoesterase family protein [Akkermansiaceae bacterium]